MYHYIICFVPLLGNSYVVGSIQTERGTRLSGLESGINIVIRNTTLVSSSLLNLKPTVIGVCMMQMCTHLLLYTVFCDNVYME